MQSPAASTNPRVGIWQQAQSRWQLVALPDQHGRGRKEICAVRRGRGSHRGRAVPSRSGARGGAGASHGVGVGHPSGAAGRRARKATVRLLSRSRSLSPGGGLAAAACCPGPRAGPRREIQSNHWWPFFASRRSLSRRHARTAGQAARLRGHHTFDTRQFHFRTGERTRSTHPLVEQREPSIIGDSARAAGSSY